MTQATSTAFRLIAATTGVGLHLGPEMRARRAELLPTFREVAEASSAHPRGPVDPTLLDAIAWTESHYRPDAEGPKLPHDVESRGYSGFERALGALQVWSGHDGKTFGSGWWPSPDGPGVVWTLDNAKELVPNTVAATDILLDAGYGGNLRETLRRYSGARPNNTPAIDDYVGKVTARHLVLTAEQLLGGGPDA